MKKVASVEEYIAGAPKAIQKKLKELRSLIKKQFRKQAKK